MCVGAVRFSIPHGWELPDGAESRVAQFSEDRDDLGRGGDRSWYARNVREEPSVAQLHLLLLISPFHIPWGFGCCLLFLSSGPSSRLCKHQRHPSLGVWRRFSPSSWEHSTLHPLRLGMGTRSCAGDRHFILFPGEQPCRLCILVCLGRAGHSQTQKAMQLHLAVPSAWFLSSIMLFHLYFRVFPLLSNPMGHLWKPWVPHVLLSLLWGPVQVPLKPVECFPSMEAFSIDSDRSWVRRSSSSARANRETAGGCSEK